MDLSTLSSQIRKEADEFLLDKGLQSILLSYGRPHVSGSYELDLMTWRDLDIYLEREDLSVTPFFELGKLLAEHLHPLKMSFRNEIRAKTPGLPTGLYWGIYPGDERNGGWKIDLWAVGQEELNRLLTVSAALKTRLSAAARAAILQIKSQCWQDPQYRKTFSSMDIYQAVLDHGISDYLAFRKYLNRS